MSTLEASIDSPQVLAQLKKRLRSLDRRRYTRCGGCGKFTESEPWDGEDELQCQCRGV